MPFNVAGMQIVIRHTDGQAFTYAGHGRGAYKRALAIHRHRHPRGVIAFSGVRIIAGYLTA